MFQEPPLAKSAGGPPAVVATKLAALTTESGPNQKPARLASTTMPLAWMLPNRCDGFASSTWFQTTDAAFGCWKRVVSPGARLKDCQFSTARSETVSVSVGPAGTAVAEPATTTRPCGLAQATGAQSSDTRPPQPRIHGIMAAAFGRGSVVDVGIAGIGSIGWEA